MARPCKPEGANWLTPYLTVSDGERALRFYEKAFGFAPGEVMRTPDGNIGHAEMRYQGNTIIMFAPEGAWGSEAKTPAHMGAKLPSNLYLYCENVDALTSRAKAAGAQVTQEPQDMFWGDRTASFTDPDGYDWMFATNVGEFDPSKIPQCNE